VRTYARKMGEIAQGVPLQGAKTCFIFLLSRQRGLSATYPAPILTIFWNNRRESFAHA